jgi:alginate O-acetyltransferase complex protein AlgI
MDFFILNINAILGTSIIPPHIPLPIGISFYTFQTMSYTIDVYRGDVKAQKNLADLMVYVTLFPQLIAGPIVRYKTVAEEIVCRSTSVGRFSYGVKRFAVGLGKKVLLANNIGMLWEKISGLDSGSLTVLTAWLGAIAYGFQIYFDFSGYSDMAIGLGEMLGFSFLENFNYPFISGSITEFWRRWHMSLGTWFKDYVYIPLGGSRKGRARNYINLVIVWFLTGLWHGASWNFVIWGLYFGAIICIEKAFLLKWWDRVWKPVRHVYVIALLCVSWVIFGFVDLAKLISYLKVMFGAGHAALFNSLTLGFLAGYGVLLLLVILCSTPFAGYIVSRLKASQGTVLQGALEVVIIPAACFVILFISTAYLVDAAYNPFLYFRF